MVLFKIKYTSFSDEQLMKCIQQQDTPAFNELYRRYSQRLLLYFYRLLRGNEHKAQDFLQDIFLKIVEKPYLFCVEKRFSTWIFSIAHNLCKNEFRRLDVRSNTEYSDDADQISIIDDQDYQMVKRIDDNLFTQALMKELNKLDAERRSIFLLRHQQDFSIKEISAIMDCAEGTVKSRLFYAIKKLADSLREFDPYSDEGIK